MHPKFISDSVRLLKLTTAQPAKCPCTKELLKLAGDPLPELEAELYRHVVGKLMHVQEDYVHSQFVIKELGRELREPSAGSMARLKHLVRFLSGRRDEVRTMQPVDSEDGINIWVDSNCAGCTNGVVTPTTFCVGSPRQEVHVLTANFRR